MPLTFFVDETGVVQKLEGWEERLKPVEKLKTVTDEVRKLWSPPGDRLDSAAIARMAAKHQANSKDLTIAVELASRYLDLKLHREAAEVLGATVKQYAAKEVARSDNEAQSKLLGQAYLQLARASLGNREDQVRYATLSFYLNPTVGFGKQIARIIAPEKFDHRPGGDFDNRFREGTLRRLKQERKEWLQE